MNITDELVQVHCCVCGVTFGLPGRIRDALEKTKDIFFCPRGHSISYAKSTEENLREALEVERQKITTQMDVASYEKFRADKAERALARLMKKAKK